jgi:hypothetical protein
MIFNNYNQSLLQPLVYMGHVLYTCSDIITWNVLELRCSASCNHWSILNMFSILVAISLPGMY